MSTKLFTKFQLPTVTYIKRPSFNIALDVTTIGPIPLSQLQEVLVYPDKGLYIDEIVYEAGKYRFRLGIHFYKNTADEPLISYVLRNKCTGMVASGPIETEKDAKDFLSSVDNEALYVCENNLEFMRGQLLVFPVYLRDERFKGVKVPSLPCDETYAGLLEQELYFSLAELKGVIGFQMDDMTEMLLRQLQIVASVPGFFFDTHTQQKPNITGWHVLQEWGSYIGPCARDLPLSEEVVTDSDVTDTCYICDDVVKSFGKHMLYGQTEPKTICDACLDDFICCDKCSCLLSTDDDECDGHHPEYYMEAGKKEGDSEYYCAKCYLELLNSGKLYTSVLIGGGTALTTDQTRTAQVMPPYQTLEGWTEIYNVNVSDNFSDFVGSRKAMQHMSKIVETAKPDDKFMIGLRPSRFCCNVILFKQE